MTTPTAEVWKNWQPLRISDEAPPHIGPPPRQRQPVVPPLVGRRVALRPPSSKDYGWLEHLWSDPELFYRVKYMGYTAPLHRIVDDSLRNTDLFFVVTRRNGEPVGYIAFYGTDLRSQTMKFMVVGNRDVQGTALMIEATFLALNYVFDTFPIRKVYADSVEFNYVSLVSSLRFRGLMETEGCLKDAVIHAGETWHLYMITICRERFAALKPRLLRMIVGPDGNPHTGPDSPTPGSADTDEQHDTPSGTRDV